MRLFYCLLLIGSLAAAQDRPVEIFASGGVGVRGAEDLSSGGYGTWTVGAGYRFRENWTAKGEFQQHRSGAINLFGGAIMREWDGDRGRPFLEFGLASGWLRQRSSFLAPGSPVLIVSHSTQSYLGVTFAGGYTFDFLDRYFVRPQVRMHLMGPIYVGVQPALAVGARF